MTAYKLKIVTPDGVQYDGQAEQLSVRTTTGDVGILAGHIDFVAPLGMGEAVVLVAGQKRRAACIGGMVSVVGGAVTLLPTTFEWAEEIDVQRAELSEARAQEVLQSKESSDSELILAKARLKRALVRKSVASRK